MYPTPFNFYVTCSTSFPYFPSFSLVHSMFRGFKGGTTNIHGIKFLILSVDCVQQHKPLPISIPSQIVPFHYYSKTLANSSNSASILHPLSQTISSLLFLPFLFYNLLIFIPFLNKIFPPLHLLGCRFLFN